jgi:hypothetical protein
MISSEQLIRVLAEFFAAGNSEFVLDRLGELA